MCNALSDIYHTSVPQANFYSRVFSLLTALLCFFSMLSKLLGLAAFFPLCFLIVSQLGCQTLRCHTTLYRATCLGRKQ